MPMQTYIQEVSLAFLDSLQPGKGDINCLGLYFCPVIDDNGEYYYIAMNNEQGELWREEFQSARTAYKWLRGYWCLNRQNVLCDGATGKRIFDIAAKVQEEIRKENERKGK